MKTEPFVIKPIQKELLYTKIADAILHYIKDNQLKTGDKIPSERILAQEFNTSRNSVREALRVLERDHIIEVKMGKGAFITSQEKEASFYLKLWKVNYREILEIKGILELSIIESLCGKLNSKDIESLNEPLIRMEQGAQMGLFLQKEDFIFHSRIRKIYQNNTLEQMIDSLIKSLDEYGSDLEGIDSIWRQTVPYHRVILNAMIDNKPFAAADAYRRIEAIDKKVLELHEQLQKKGREES